MAYAGENAAEKLREITECPICMSAFNEPRILPCIHTFCLKCLLSTGEAAQKKSGDKMPCPICRKEFTIPKEGMTGLQKHFFIENLMEFKTMLQVGSTSVSCDMCKISNKGKTSTATMKCLECKANYCDNCSKVHQKQKLSINHHIVKIGKESEEIRRVISVRTCNKHFQKILDYYCADCKKIVCVSCFVESHKLHDCKDVATVDEKFRQTIEKNTCRISTFADEILSMRKTKETKKADFLKEIEEKEHAILKRNQELKNMIDEHTKSLLEELCAIKSKHLKEVVGEMEEIDRCWTILRSFEAYCAELRSKGSANDICNLVDDITLRANELQKDHTAFISRPRKSVEVSFKSADLREVLMKSDNNVVGQIKETTTWFGNYATVVGLSDDTTYNIVQINMNRPNQITTQKRIPITMQMEATSAVNCNTMYVVGLGDNADEIWKYNMSSGWMKCASLVQGRHWHSAAFVDDVLYICGGYKDSAKRVLDSVEAYNTVTVKCSIVGKLVHCVRNSGNCVPFKTSLYIFGGFDKDFYELNHVQVYDTKRNSCTLLSKPMPQRCSLMRALLWETSAILVGSDTCFIFNFETETWKERQQFKIDVVCFGLVLENERIFVIGGGHFEKKMFRREKIKCRDDVRYVPLRNFIEGKPIEWKICAKLPKPALIVAYEKLTGFLQ